MVTKNVLVIVDMQNDFITGSLANKAAEDIVAPMCDFIKGHKWDLIAATLDTHNSDYLKTNEGKHLPTVHCQEGTEGWNLNADIVAAVNSLKLPFSDAVLICKSTFGDPDVAAAISSRIYVSEDTELNIYMVGTCTDICVVSNALLLKSLIPEANIKIIKPLTAGTTPENAEAALTTMKNCQCEIMEDTKI